MLEKNFLLIEEKQYFSASIIEKRALDSLKPRCIEINYLHFTAEEPVVLVIIQAILEAQLYNVPLILNRTGQKLDEKKLPSSFVIGLLTSGTTGVPKLVFHNFDDILPVNTKKNGQSRWLLCYHPMSFAGLQVILQAIVCGDVLIASVFSDVRQKAQECIDYQVTALSATPSFMRALLLCWEKAYPPLKTITCGGELCDQETINALSLAFPSASIRHIYATTETGVLFTVKDGQEGFPCFFLQQEHHGWCLAICNDELIASHKQRVVATGDRVLIDKQRVYFKGRLDNVVNIGGVKVDLEQIERRVLDITEVIDARVYARRSPITGAVVCVELQSKFQDKAKERIAQLNRQLLPAEQLRVIHFVDTITLSDTGKKQRTF